MKGIVSSRVTFFELADGDTIEIAGGEPITVHQILISITAATSNRQVDIRTADGDIFMSTELDIGDHFLSDTPFLADKGIEFFDVNSNVLSLNVTVWHSNPGL